MLNSFEVCRTRCQSQKQKADNKSCWLRKAVHCLKAVILDCTVQFVSTGWGRGEEISLQGQEKAEDTIHTVEL